ncbi:MAG: CDP-alcohol phosphatidyltransferase family protein [Gemmatimonadetes bacterium]|nr:CDP-alcohol phosphatidyltransferase family protein [Gemmatimonadota bacterium]
MITATPTRPAPRAPIGAPPRLGVDLVVGGACAASVSAATCWLLALPTSQVAASLVLYAVLAGLVRLTLPAAQPGPGIGPANRITLLRATLVLPIAALAMTAMPMDARGYAWIVALSTAAMMLDGVDGRVARRTGTSTPFGARFDMELDAFLLIALALLLSRSGKTGSWVILIGGLRYLFVFAGMLWPLLQRPLPPSLRRKSVCVGQGVSLLAALAPVTPPAVASLITGMALVGLVYSFAVDVRWLTAPEASISRVNSCPMISTP